MKISPFLIFESLLETNDDDKIDSSSDGGNEKNFPDDNNRVDDYDDENHGYDNDNHNYEYNPF